MEHNKNQSLLPHPQLNDLFISVTSSSSKQYTVTSEYWFEVGYVLPFSVKCHVNQEKQSCLIRKGLIALCLKNSLVYSQKTPKVCQTDQYSCGFADIQRALAHSSHPGPLGICVIKVARSIVHQLKTTVAANSVLNRLVLSLYHREWIVWGRETELHCSISTLQRPLVKGLRQT